MKKITIPCFLLCSFILQVAIGQVPSWAWAKKAGRAKGDRSNAVAADSQGNFYAAGEFQSQFVQCGNSAFSNFGYGSDIFIVKYDSTGFIVWAESFGGTDHDVATDICTDPMGNIYMVGYFYSSQAIFGNDTLRNTTTGSSDLYYAKISSYGSILWIYRVGGSGNDKATKLSLDASGNLFVAGNFDSNSIIFGTDTLFNSNTGTTDAFITKITPNGNVLWSKSLGGGNDDDVTSVHAQANGETYVTGNFKSSTLTLGGTLLVNAGGSDLFLSKLDPNGNFLWALSAGGAFDDSVHSVSANAHGDIFLVGGFNSDSISFAGANLINTAAGTSDAFISKFDSSGSLLWCKSISGANSETAIDIKQDAAGNSYICGTFTSLTISIDTFVLTNSNNGPDIFLAKYNPNGLLFWAKKVSGSSDDVPTDIAMCPDGSIIYTGYFLSPSLNVGASSLSNPGNCTPFLIRYLSNGTFEYGDYVAYNNSSADVTCDVATDSRGNAYISGWFKSSSLHFDTTEIRNTGTGFDLFIVQYDSAGNVGWTKGAKGKGFDFGAHLCIDPFDNLYTLGNHADTITLDSILLAGSNTFFVSKIDQNGNVRWAKDYGESASADDICSDNEGNIYITGWFSGNSVVFGTDTLTNAFANYTDLFVLKLDSAGNVLWAKSATGNNNDFSNGIATDQLKNVYITGYFDSDSISFNSNTIVHSSGNFGQDMYLVKLDSNGIVVWAKGAGAAYNDDPQSLCVDPAGNVYLTGFFCGPNLVLGSVTLTNPSVSIKESFIAKYKF